MSDELQLKKKFVFMHVGKTAGTTVKTVVQTIRNEGSIGPAVANHTMSLEAVIKKFPEAKISVILRDPLERIISGFNSRLRQGRPVYDRVWSAKEATAFSFFRDVETFLRACISTDDHDISAARFACSAIKHIRNGYARSFTDASTVRSEIGRFYCIGHIKNMRNTLAGIFGPFAVDPVLYQTLAPQHASNVPSYTILNNFSSKQVAALRAHFSEEYDIYNEFMRHVSVEISD